MSRQYPPAPIVGVGVITINDEKKVLLVKRGNEPRKGLWSVPGGMVELGERVREAGIREVKEECNIDVEPEEVISVVDIILKDQNNGVKYHYVLIEYLAKYLGGEVQAQSDVLEAGWFARTELDDLDLPEVTRKVIEKAYDLQTE
jgi:ADP-ribose pyrophosphatase YjhB (NUDIX family)